MPHHEKKKVIGPRFLTHKAEAHRRKTKKSKSAGGAKQKKEAHRRLNQKNRSAAVQAARYRFSLYLAAGFTRGFRSLRAAHTD